MRGAPFSGFAFLLVSCRAHPNPSACHGWLAPGGSLSDAQTNALIDRMRHGEEPCPEWLRPTMDVGPVGVKLDGTRILWSSELPSGRGERLPAVWRDLADDRELWKMGHPARDFEGVLDVTFSGDVDAVAGVSVLESAAHAGYCRMHVHVPAGDVFLRWVPDRALDDDAPRPEMITLSPRDVDAALSLAAARCSTSANRCPTQVIIYADDGKLAPLVVAARAIAAAAVFKNRQPQIAFDVPGWLGPQ